MTRRKHVSSTVIAISMLVAGVVGIRAQSSVSLSTRDQAVRGTVRIEPLNDRQLRVRVENAESAVLEATGFVLTWTDKGVLQIVADREATIRSAKGDVRIRNLQMQIGPSGFLSASGTGPGQKQ